MKKEHQDEMKVLIEGFGKEKEEVEKSWKEKVEEQIKYISILE